MNEFQAQTKKADSAVIIDAVERSRKANSTRQPHAGTLAILIVGSVKGNRNFQQLDSNPTFPNETHRARWRQVDQYSNSELKKVTCERSRQAHANGLRKLLQEIRPVQSIDQKMTKAGGFLEVECRKTEQQRAERTHPIGGAYWIRQSLFVKRAMSHL